VIRINIQPNGPGMEIDIAAALNLLAHELRAPTGVIQGYARMLADPRFDEEGKPRMLAQVQEAAGRIAVLGREAVEISRWLDPARAASTETITLRQLIERAIAESGVESSCTMHIPPEEEDDGRNIATIGAKALVAALATLIRATARETPGAPLVVAVRPSEEHLAYDVLIGSGSLAEVAASDTGPNAPGSAPVGLGRGGLGLSLVLAAVVLDARHSRIWTVAKGDRGIIGVQIHSKEQQNP
jgi:signal transduction histidine kinase